MIVFRTTIGLVILFGTGALVTHDYLEFAVLGSVALLVYALTVSVLAFRRLHRVRKTLETLERGRHA